MLITIELKKFQLMGFLHLKHLYFLSLLVFTKSVQVTAQKYWNPLYYCQGGNYKNNSTFEKNLNATLATLSSNITGHKRFYTVSIGQGLDKVYGMLLCIRGNQSRKCKECADISTEYAAQNCPNAKEYVVWYDEGCMLRYSNRSIFSVMEIYPELSGQTSVRRVGKQFPRIVKKLMTRLISRATNSSSIINFATGDVSYIDATDGTITIYGLVQCTPDISRSDCNRCLSFGVDKVNNHFNPPSGYQQGGGMITRSPSCYLRFDFNSFYEIRAGNAPSLSIPLVPVPQQAQLVPQPQARPQDSTTPLLVASVAAAVVLIFAVVIYLRKLVWGTKEKIYSKTGDGALVAFTYRELQNFTKNFSQKLGGGGFGSVFKGVLPDASYIAVKKLEGLRQGEKQFRAEVSTIGMIQHVNLVCLRGFCSEGAKRLLVYEFMPNGSLDSYLFNRKNTEVLDWKTRYQIALGIARGLTYLHEKCRDSIIHCDIKPENILLDAEFNPKIADFGLAKLVNRDFSRVLTTMRGTRGYLAPEWISGVAITPKADVYSYGKMLFEIISGKRNSEHFSNDEKISYIPAWAATKMNEGDDIISLVDIRLEGKTDILELTRACKVACWCIQDDEAHRPSMSQVVHILEGLSDVNCPPISRSLHFLVENQDNVFLVIESSNQNSQAGINNTSITSFGSVPEQENWSTTLSMRSEDS